MEQDTRPAADTIKDLENLDVAEVDDEDLEDVSGGHNGNCGCVVPKSA